MPLLPTIRTPADLRRLPIESLQALADEIRSKVIESVAANGGHLSSNLGTVDLTLALHYVYDFGPYPIGPDRLLWDVGHQAYAHKMLTGRAGQFATLRKKGSVSGFPSPDESPYDLFAVGHAGTAVSTAVGMARGDRAAGRKSHVVAVVGDASIVNGLSLEGLNNAGTLDRQLLIILNDNGMSISSPQGAFSQYLERVRVSTTYDEFKRLSERLVHALPDGMSHSIESAWRSLSSGVKGVMWPGQIFEAMGLKYMGPIDGHDLPGLINFLAEIRHVDRPMLLHVKTRKGQGYEVATNEPTKFHSPPGFSINTRGVQMNSAQGKTWTNAFSDALSEIAAKDPRVFALTAAMPDGTGLASFGRAFPEQYLDTGICESHLVAMAAGMAKGGLKPVAAIYSTFLQRAFDQVWQEVVLNAQPVLFCLDRAGLVGDDGAVHHGFCDVALLRALPGMVLMAPSDELELARALRLGLSLETAASIRYPRDNVPAVAFEQEIEPSLRDDAAGEWTIGKSRRLRHGDDATLIVYGALVESALTAAEQLEERGIRVGIIDARFCKPLDTDMLKTVLVSGHPVLTVEDHTVHGGFGSAVLEQAVHLGLPTDQLTCLGMPDRLIAHATRRQQLAEVGLDPAGLSASVQSAITSATGVPVNRQ